MILTLLVLTLSIKVSNNKNENQNSKRSLHNNETFIIEAKASQATNCPSVDPDATGCATAIANVASLDVTNWVPENLEGVVNAFLASCKATQCNTACATLVNAKDFTDEDTSYKTNFARDCALVTAVPTATVGTCTPPGTNAGDCETAYQAVLTAIPSTATDAWSSSGIKGAIDSYITKCAATSCKPTCSAGISGVNVVTRYSSLRTTFQNECNPVEPPAPTSGGIKILKMSTLLIVISFGIGIIEGIIGK
jgi:hypothetical protein